MHGNVLIVDDARVVRTALGRIMKKCGYGVVEAENGQEALEQLDADRQIRIVFLDINMPVMDGMAFLEAFGKTAAPRPPVIVVSTETEASSILKAISLGASEYVMKPFDEAIIKGKLDILGIEYQP